MKNYLLSTVLICILSLHIQAQQKINVGIIEFEEKNNIGLENAGIIVPEMLVSHLAQIGKYKLTERILQKKVLKEQKLQTTGIIDEETAVELGKIYGVEGIVTGSLMKIGSKIKISGRLIKTETGEIITSGSISLKDIENIEERLESLAYQLSGTSKEGYSKLTVEKEISKNKYGIRLGSGYVFNNSDANPSSGIAGISPGLYFYSKHFDLEVTGVIPPSSVTLLSVKTSFNFSTHLGVGFFYNYVYDGLSADNETIDGKGVATADIHCLGIGINYRATESLRAGFFLGATLSSEIDYKRNTDNFWGTYEGNTYYTFPASAYFFNLEYYITKNFSVNGIFTQNTGYGDLTKDGNYTYPDDFPENYDFQSGAILLQLGYSFSFE